MKIGILTYHRAENLGAVLQAYALVTYLRSQGHDAEIIDYRCRNIEIHYDILNPAVLLSRKNVVASLREYLGRFANIRDRITKKHRFEEFRRLLPMSWPVCSPEKFAQYDAIITGSDQVWNFHINRGDERVYLLDFGGNDFQRIAYAASSEKNGLTPLPTSVTGRALERFQKISVREAFLREELKDICKKDISICLDPVFLLPAEKYREMAVKTATGNYILVFHMTYSREAAGFAGELAKKKGLKLIECFGGVGDATTETSVSNWGPREMLGYIANADMVFTTSFHGLALSLILHRNVWLVNKGANYRQRNLLALAGLEDRMLSSRDGYNDAEIDYRVVDSRLEAAIMASKDFLNLSSPA